ncbi:MAG: uncharacterized protein KVP18_004543 [Porospora cf. gigantea A]|uniref:uncharacterized protein n=1 Tax=Porospora cf. gigantea A TaxID=2853593 RepID=UPI003559C8B2|nr:MAG: hypothetical protein KVP18_004543 [Porospora cf. gigantea A]
MRCAAQDDLHIEAQDDLRIEVQDDLHIEAQDDLHIEAQDDLRIEAPSGRPKDSLRFEPSEGDIESEGGRYIFLNVRYPPSTAAKIRSVLENDRVKGLPQKSKLEVRFDCLDDRSRVFYSLFT